MPVLRDHTDRECRFLPLDEVQKLFQFHMLGVELRVGELMLLAKIQKQMEQTVVTWLGTFPDCVLFGGATGQSPKHVQYRVFAKQQEILLRAQTITGCGIYESESMSFDRVAGNVNIDLFDVGYQRPIRRFEHTIEPMRIEFRISAPRAKPRFHQIG